MWLAMAPSLIDAVPPPKGLGQQINLLDDRGELWSQNAVSHIDKRAYAPRKSEGR